MNGKSIYMTQISFLVTLNSKLQQKKNFSISTFLEFHIYNTSEKKWICVSQEKETLSNNHWDIDKILAILVEN